MEAPDWTQIASQQGRRYTKLLITIQVFYLLCFSSVLDLTSHLPGVQRSVSGASRSLNYFTCLATAEVFLAFLLSWRDRYRQKRSFPAYLFHIFLHLLGNLFSSLLSTSAILFDSSYRQVLWCAVCRGQFFINHLSTTVYYQQGNCRVSSSHQNTETSKTENKSCICRGI